MGKYQESENFCFTFSNPGVWSCFENWRRPLLMVPFLHQKKWGRGISYLFTFIWPIQQRIWLNMLVYQITTIWTWQNIIFNDNKAGSIFLVIIALRDWILHGWLKIALDSVNTHYLKSKSFVKKLKHLQSLSFLILVDKKG